MHAYIPPLLSPVKPTTTRRSRACDGGFTLVEILIVIVILGILGTVTVFAVRGVSDKGEEASCSTDRRIIGDAVEFYMANERTDVIPPSGGADADRYERTLVAAGLLGDVSDYHDLAADGTITSTGVPCP